jgi:eukaryotic-like serine/threonine-protein kinase
MKHSRFLITVFLIIAPPLFWSGCTGVHLSQMIVPGSDDWLMSGGLPEQHNISKSVIEPPLELVWSYNIDAGIGYSAISVSDGVVFVNNLQGEMYCIDVSTGGKIGQLNFLGKEANTTPLIDGNDIYVAFAGDNKYSLVCYNLLEGDIKWRRRLGYIQTSPVLKNAYIYAGSINGKFYKLDKSGRIEWKFNSGSPIHSTCAILGDKAVFGNDDGYIYCIGTADGLSEWKFKTGGPIMAAPLVFNDKVFIGSYDSNYYCLDIDSGSKVWSTNLKTKLFSGSTLFNDSSVVFGGIDGNLYSININNGSVNWTFNTNGVITSTPLASGRYIYFSSYDRFLYCVDGNNGKALWSYEMEGKGKTSPVIWRDLLFAADDIDLICFKHKKR